MSCLVLFALFATLGAAGAMGRARYCRWRLRGRLGRRLAELRAGRPAWGPPPGGRSRVGADIR